MFAATSQKNLATSIGVDMSKEITMTKEGGFYYRALAVHALFVSVLIVPVFLLTLVAILNPFWFRQDMFHFLERSVNRLARWRDRLKYRAYLGYDPTVWDALKDTK